MRGRSAIVHLTIEKPGFPYGADEVIDPTRSSTRPRVPDMTTRLPIVDAELADFCARHHIRRLALFGSVLKGVDQPGSDVDLLVEFEATASPSLFDMVMMEDALSGLLGGRPVDLRTSADLSRYFRDEVVRTAAVLYAR
jgi:uncharacterized protein